MQRARMDSQREQTFDLDSYFNTLWRRKWLVLGFIGLVITGAYAFTKRQEKVYEAVSQVVIERSAPQYLTGQAGMDVVSLGVGNYWSSGEYLETQYRILKSRQVAKMVVDRLDLRHDSKFMGFDKIEDPEKRARAEQGADAVQTLVSKLTIEPVEDSYIVFIKVRDRTPKTAALIADTVADCYAESNLNRKISGAREAVAWLNRQASDLRGELERADNALLEFKREHNILSASLADKQNLVTQSLQEAERRLRSAKGERIRLESALEQVRALTVAEAETTFEDVLGNGLIQRLKEQIVELQNERTDLLTRYLEQHPSVLAVNTKIERVQKALQREVKGIRTSLGKRYKAALQTERRLAADLQVVELQASALTGRELAYRRLQSEVETKKQLFAQIMVRLKESELQAELRANNVRVLDHAMVPAAPVYPRPLLNLVIAAFLALVSGVGLAFLVENLDTSIKSQAQLENELGLTFLGIIPSVQPSRRRRFESPIPVNSDRYVIDFPKSTLAECVRTIRTNLLFMVPERELRTLCITSPGPREGKTSTCVNVGATMALSGSRVLIVDSDLRRPRLHEIFDVTNERGLTNMIVDPAVTVDSVIRNTDVEGLDILCSGAVPPNPAELLQSSAFKRTRERLLENYDRVIFDSPPVAAVTDAQILGNTCDGTMLVVRAGKTRRELVAKAKRLLDDVNVNLLGALLNNFDVSKRVYGQYYYQYYRQYGAHYGRDDAQASES